MAVPDVSSFCDVASSVVRLGWAMGESLEKLEILDFKYTFFKLIYTYHNEYFCKIIRNVVVPKKYRVTREL